jgi:DNA-binding LytR/AlgR family response regulator
VIRILYWGLINLAAWILTASLAIGIEQFLKSRIQPLTKHVEISGAVLAGCLSAIPLAFVVVLANRLALPYSTNPQAINSLPNFLSLLSHIAPLTVLISVLYTLWHHRQSSDNQPSFDEADAATGDELSESTSSPFFDRLPKHLGKDLLRLSSQDHYLEVKTTLGKDLILMRLGDAVKELENYSGARIHRSHWIADAAVEWIETREGRFFAHLSDESCLPISRTYRQVPSQRGWPTSRK